MINVRSAKQIFTVKGEAGHGVFEGRRNFSFGTYVDSRHNNFGVLKAFNDDTFSPGAAAPLHSQRDVEVVTYCVQGEFRHFDDKGHDGVLKKGWIQHASAGSGIRHSEINNLTEQPLRFIQLLFVPHRKGEPPHYEQKPVQKRQRTNKLLPLVSNVHLGALKINSDAEVFSSFLQRHRHIRHPVREGRGLFAYVVEGGPVMINGKKVSSLGCAEISGETSADITAEKDAELILADVRL